MPPRRYIALIPSLIFLLWLILVQQNHQPFLSAFAQNAPDTTDHSTAALDPDDLPITLIATNNSPQMAGTSITLTATVASGNSAGLSYSWNFGDGQTAQGRVVRHTYTQPGTYSAFVIATNGPDSKRATTEVIVSPIEFLTPTPTLIRGLQATSDSPVIAGNPVSFLATVAEGTEVTYLWNFGDGSPAAIGPSVSHVYPNPGKYTVTLYAQNSLGSATTTILVEILDAPPKGLRILHTTPLVISNSSNFTATVESGTNVQYQWSISNGTLFYGPHFSYQFSKTGNYEIRVRASNAAGEIFANEIITVHDRLPIILKTFDDSPKSAKQSISFLARIQSNSPVTTYWWWGDGEVDVVPSTPEQAAQAIKEIPAIHDYDAKGKYIVTLIVYNQGGSASSEFIAYTDMNKPLSLPISWTPTIPVFGHSTTFSVPLDPDLYVCKWDFGDGTKIENGPIVQHTYTTANSYIVYAQCATTANEDVQDADRIIHVGTTLYMPILASNGSFGREAPTATPEVAGESTPDPTVEQPTIDTTLTPTATAIIPPPVADTPTPTETATIVPDPPTPTETPIPTPTEVIGPGGTIPPIAPIPTATELGGTIPPIAPP